MSFCVQPYNKGMAEEWDNFVNKSAVGTLLHTRRFLSYHGERFIDRSLIVRNEKEDIVALFPAALLPSNSLSVMSHPGITYGGIIGGDNCQGESSLQVLRAICRYYGEQGLERLLYKVVPHFYHRMPMQDDLYALFRMGASRYRCDLSATIDLQHRGRIGSRRKRSYKKAVKAGVKVVTGIEYAAQLWKVLSDNLVKHNARPVHSLEEILLLHKRFQNDIRFVSALVDGQVEAGLVLFETPLVTHAQYIASSEIGYSINALDLLFEHSIAEAEAQGRRYFDFGISTEEGGRTLNEGLYNFKSEFGAGGCVHEFYEIELGEQGDT